MLTLTTIKLVVLAILFVLTSGLIGTYRFRKFFPLVILASLIAIGSTYYLFIDVFNDVVETVVSRIEIQREPRKDLIARQPTKTPPPVLGRLKNKSETGVDNSPIIIALPQLAGQTLATPYRRIVDVLSLESIEHSEGTSVPFPIDYLNVRLTEELGASATVINRIRLGATFVEPFASRHLASSGTIIGHVLITLPTITDCQKIFDDRTYRFPQASTGLMRAISENAEEIANWIRNASRQEIVRCPID